MDLSVSYIYGEAWTLTKKHGLKVAVLLIISIIITIGMNVIAMPSEYWTEASRAFSGDVVAAENMQSFEPNILATILQYLLSFIISCITYALLIGCTRGTDTSLRGAVKLPATTYLKYLVVQFIYVLAFIVGLILLIAPGVYVGVRLAWAPYYIVENEDASIGEALKWSWQATDDRMLELMGLALISVVIAGVTGIVAMIVFVPGAMLGTIGITIAAVVITAAVMCVSVYVNFAMTQTYCELGGANIDAALCKE